MIWLDTNVVVRYLVQDNPDEATASTSCERHSPATAMALTSRFALIAELGRAAGCDHTVTIDQRAARDGVMHLLRSQQAPNG